MFALRMPTTAFFSHSTAARLHGIPVPLRLERSSFLHIAVPAPARAPHASGIRGHRLTIAPTDVVMLNGIRVAAPARTWCDLGSEVDLLPLVAAGDAIIHWQLPLASIDQLVRAVRLFPGRRGLRLLAEALPLLRDRAESPPESELRVILQLAGLPEPDINHVMVDTETGKDVRPDFRFEEYRVILEYQGDYHRTKAQWRRDMTRRERLHAQGWLVMEINADDLRNPDELVARIRSVLRQRGMQ